MFASKKSTSWHKVAKRPPSATTPWTPTLETTTICPVEPNWEMPKYQKAEIRTFLGLVLHFTRFGDFNSRNRLWCQLKADLMSMGRKMFPIGLLSYSAQ